MNRPRCPGEARIPAAHGLTVAMATFERFVARATRLYQQGRKEPSGPSRLGIYVRRRSAWAGAELGGAGRRPPAVNARVPKIAKLLLAPGAGPAGLGPQ